MQKIGDENRIYKRISANAMNILLKHPFPGNVRELENIVERMLIMSVGEEIQEHDLPSEVRSHHVGPLEAELAQGMNLRYRLRALELEIIQEALRRFGTQRRAARSASGFESVIVGSEVEGPRGVEPIMNW